MSDDRNLPDNKDKPEVPSHAPAQWERRQPTPGTESGGLQQRLASGDESEYTADERQQTTHLADSQQSLGSKLTGGGRDLGEDSGSEETKLCQGCGAVTTYVQGMCTKCGYKGGIDGAVAPPAFGDSPIMPHAEGSPALRYIVGAAGILAIIAIIVVLVMKFTGGSGDTAVDGAATSDTVRSTTLPAGASEPANFMPVEIDDAFHNTLAAQLLALNDAWEDAQVDCYIYRYGIYERKEVGESQQITITGYAGGSAAAGFVPNGDSVLKETLANYLQGFNNRGIETVVYVEFTAGDVTPGITDKYIRYGLYYAREHWDRLETIVAALEGIKETEGQYPHSLSKTIIRPKIQTHGGLGFTSSGFGYLPIYKTDSAGQIIMGTGKGVASFYPEECIGYVLIKFLVLDNEGLDILGPQNLSYYREHITPFPYEPKIKLHNVKLEPDGEPDGVACVIITGEIQDS